MPDNENYGCIYAQPIGNILERHRHLESELQLSQMLKILFGPSEQIAPTMLFLTIEIRLVICVGL
jgi:hypothetical protein